MPVQNPQTCCIPNVESNLPYSRYNSHGFRSRMYLEPQASESYSRDADS